MPRSKPVDLPENQPSTSGSIEISSRTATRQCKTPKILAVQCGITSILRKRKRPIQTTRAKNKRVPQIECHLLHAYSFTRTLFPSCPHPSPNKQTQVSPRSCPPFSAMQDPPTIFAVRSTLFLPPRFSPPSAEHPFCHSLCILSSHSHLGHPRVLRNPPLTGILTASRAIRTKHAV